MEGKIWRGFQERAIRMTCAGLLAPGGLRDPSRSRAGELGLGMKDRRLARSREQGRNSSTRELLSPPPMPICALHPELPLPHTHKTRLAIYFSNQGGTQEMQGCCSTAKQPMRATCFLGLKGVRWPGLDHIEKGLTFALCLKALRKAMEST